MIYLDNGATSFPKPASVMYHMNECMSSYCANPGRSGHKMTIKISDMVYECRQMISDLFNVGDASRVIFTLNATDALNTGIKGVLLPGDNVIYSSMEHNSVIRPINALRSSGIRGSVALADDRGYVSAEAIERLVNPDTRLIVITHASNVCGSVNDIREIGRMAKKHGVLFMVDASQSAGVIDIDMERDFVDILACPGHKALYGPQGTGVLCFKDGLFIKSLREGGTGSYSENPYQPSELPDKLESGTLNGVGICGLLEGVRFVKKTGVENIHSHEMMLMKKILEGLSNMKDVTLYGNIELDDRVGVVSFNVGDKSPTEVAHELDGRYNIATRAGFHCAYMAHKTLGSDETGSVRVSLGAFNKLSEINYLLDAINRIRKA